MYTLGINAVYHDPAAALVKDGQVVAAAEEERFTKIKHGKRPSRFRPSNCRSTPSTTACARPASTSPTSTTSPTPMTPTSCLNGHRRTSRRSSLPLEPSAHPVPEEWEAAWDPLFLSSHRQRAAPPGRRRPAPPRRRAFAAPTLDGPFRWHFVEHHLAHAASAFLPSPFDEAAILTLDGRGEKATTTYGMGPGHSHRAHRPGEHAALAGYPLRAVTDYLGFLHSSDEYKVMALASFGKPIYLAEFRDIIQLGERRPVSPSSRSDLEETLRAAPRRRAGRSSSGTTISPTRSRWSLEETALELAAGCTGKPAWRTWRWPAGWR